MHKQIINKNDMNKIVEPRQNFIDIAKGFGIIFVLLAHNSGIPKIGFIIWSFYVPLFYVCSGFTYKDNNNLIQCICKRKKLLSTYFFYAAILFGVWIFRNIIQNTNIGLDDVKLKILGILYSRYCFFPLYSGFNYLLLDGFMSPLWFCTSLFVSSVIFYIVMKLIRRDPLKVRRYILILILITMLFYKLPILLPWSIDTSFLGCLFMLAGYYVKKGDWLNKLSHKKNIPFLFFVFILFVFLAKVNGRVNMSVKIYGQFGEASIFLYLFTGCVGSILFLLFCYLVKKIKIFNIVAYIGKKSLPILGFHLLIIKLISELVIKQNNDGISDFMYIIINSITIIIILSADSLKEKIKAACVSLG